MAEKKRKRAKAFNRDPHARTQVAVLRMAGFSARKIAKITGRHLRSVEAEMRKPEHYALIRRLVAPVAKKRLSDENWKLIENAMKEREKEREKENNGSM